MKRTFFLMITVFGITAHAQEDKLKADFSGMIGLSHYDRTTALTFGGPRVVYGSEKFSAGLSFYPSILKSDYPDDEDVRPLLGFGPELNFEHLVIFLPTYYIIDRYRTTVGIGYRF